MSGQRKRAEPPPVLLGDNPCYCSRWDLPHVHTLARCWLKNAQDLAWGPWK